MCPCLTWGLKRKRGKKKKKDDCFLIGEDYSSWNNAAQDFLWLKMFQWDSDGVTEQVMVVVVRSGPAAGGYAWFGCPSLMSCKVASVQKMHRGHPRTGYFRNEKLTTRGDGINRARCPVLLGQTETTTGGPEREKGEGWDAQRCSAPAEISSTSGKHIVSTRLVLVNGANPNPLSTIEEWMAVLSPPPLLILMN